MSQVDVRWTGLQVPCRSHVEKQHQPSRRMRVCLCCSSVFGSEYIINMCGDEYGGV